MKIRDFDAANEPPEDESFAERLERYLNEPITADEIFEEDGPSSITLLEDAQDLLIHLQSEDVRKVLPIPLWNQLIRVEREVTDFLCQFLTDELEDHV